MTQLSQSVRLDVVDNVAILTVDNPPVNALSWHVRQGLYDGIAAALDQRCSAIVLICDGRTFIAGADIAAFGSAPQGADLTSVQQAIESAPVPVVAAIHGTALGGGLEVALCTHFRVALASAKCGLPEVHLGLIPGAGGTQRLPRLVGVPLALDMVTSGRHVSAPEALEHGLVDKVVEGELSDLREVAIAFAQQAVADGLPLERVRDRSDCFGDAAEIQAAIADARQRNARRSRGFLAPDANVDAIEAAVSLSFDEGIEREREIFGQLMAGTQSAAQRYYFFAERAAAKIPGVDKTTPTMPINRVGVLGAGTMGGGIAMNFANIGIPVTMVERAEDALDRGLSTIKKNYGRSRSMTPELVDERMALITGSVNKADFADCDLVIEAVFEDMELKKTIFSELDEICKPGAILASNTSALDLNEIASATARPDDVIGMHFFSPANIMKLLEVVRGDHSSPSTIKTVMSLGKKIGKVAVLVGVCHGFVGNRMLRMRGIEAERLVLEGATPDQVDRLMHDFGMPMGPFAMIDLAGLDIGWNPDTSSSSTIREVLCESGRRGQKSGNGYYIYDTETRAKTPDPEVVEIIRGFAESNGVTQREIGDDEVLERCLYPSVNEGAKLLEEGIASRASDVDVVWVNGYGWPAYRGGPMFWADSVGLDKVLERVRFYADEVGGSHWEPAPLLERLVSDGTALHDFRL
ncbi:MAG: 3-hydroxyacyl-CoA dehydrogenase NAD-binding domain-containing protein [Ilumatobacteraceae bacterium]